MIRKIAIALTGVLVALAVMVRLKPDTTYAQAGPYDLVIRNGRVIDGTGSPWYRADVAVRGDTIALIAPSIPDKAARVIDANGHIVSPDSSISIITRAKTFLSCQALTTTSDRVLRR